MPVWIIIVAAVAAVFVIAAVVVGREARRLDSVPPRPVFDLDEAVAWVAGHVPFEVAAELSHDDVRRIIRWHLEFLRTKGVSSNGHGAQSHGSPIVVAGGETVDYVLHRASAEGLELDAVQVHAVVDAQMTYLQNIGAVGPPAPPGETGRP